MGYLCVVNMNAILEEECDIIDVSVFVFSIYLSVFFTESVSQSIVSENTQCTLCFLWNICDL